MAMRDEQYNCCSHFPSSDLSCSVPDTYLHSQIVVKPCEVQTWFRLKILDRHPSGSLCYVIMCLMIFRALWFLFTTFTSMNQQSQGTLGNSGNQNVAFQQPPRQDMEYICAGLLYYFFSRITCSNLAFYNRLRGQKRDKATRTYSLQRMWPSYHV